MEEVIKKDISEVLLKIIEILKGYDEADATEVSDISNNTIHNASIFQDEDSTSIAILVYSLSKIMHRKKFEVDYRQFSEMFKAALDKLRKNDPDGYRKEIEKIFKLISKVDSKLRFYIEEVISQAQIKKGSKLYEHGISLARASEVLGISQWELMNYIGKTSIIDAYEKEIISMKDRLKYARSLFR